MNAAAARSIAYIAARLSSGAKASAVWDQAESSHTSIDGVVTDDKVEVYDYTAGCHVSGSGSNGKFNLYHYGNSAHISLEQDGKGGYGRFDYASSRHYSLTISGKSVTMFDYETSQYRYFSI